MPSEITMLKRAHPDLVPAFAVAFVAKILAVVVAVGLGRHLGPHAFGVYGFALGLGMIAARVFAAGWPTLSQRVMPDLLVSAAQNVRAFSRIGDVLVCASAFAGAVSLWALSGMMEVRSDLALGMLGAAALLPLFAFRALLRNQLGALGRPAHGMLIDELIPALLMCVALVWVASINQALWAYFGASLTAVAVAAFLRSQLLPPVTAIGPDSPLQTGLLIKGGLVAMVAMTAKLLLTKSDVIMLAPLSDMTQVGLYGAAHKLTFVQTAPIIVLATSLTPALARGFSHGDMAEVRRQFRFGVLAALGLAVPMAVLFLCAPSNILSMTFGPGFLAAGFVLPTLALAQIATAVSIVTTATLMMANRAFAVGVVTLAALVINIGINFSLIPGWGAEGAAISSLCAMVGLCGAQFVLALRVLRAPS